MSRSALSAFSFPLRVTFHRRCKYLSFFSDTQMGKPAQSIRKASDQPGCCTCQARRNDLARGGNSGMARKCHVPDVQYVLQGTGSKTCWVRLNNILDYSHIMSIDFVLFYQSQIAFLKSYSTRSARETAQDAVQIFGGRGITQTGMGRFIEHVCIYFISDYLRRT